MEKMGREGPKWGREGLFPANPDLADNLGRTDLDFAFFHFLDFFGFLGHFFRKFLKKRDFSPKKVPKIRKNAKNEKFATNNFFGLLWASHSQKTGHQGSNMEN